MKWPTADLGNPNVFVRGTGGVAVLEAHHFRRCLFRACFTEALGCSRLAAERDSDSQPQPLRNAVTSIHSRLLGLLCDERSQVILPSYGKPP